MRIPNQIPDSDWQRQCGRRLRQARIALGYETLQAFCETHALMPGSTGDQENGKSWPQPQVLKVLKRYGISSDWIWFGVYDGIDPTRIKDLERAKHHPRMRYKATPPT